MNKKRILEDYEYKFYPTLGQVLINPALNLKQSQILMIINLSGNVLIYNFACALEGARFEENKLSLVKDISGMNASDKLMIVVTEEDKAEYYLEKIYKEINSLNKILINQKSHNNGLQS